MSTLASLVGPSLAQLTDVVLIDRWLDMAVLAVASALKAQGSAFWDARVLRLSPQFADLTRRAKCRLRRIPLTMSYTSWPRKIPQAGRHRACWALANTLIRILRANGKAKRIAAGSFNWIGDLARRWRNP